MKNEFFGLLWANTARASVKRLGLFKFTHPQTPSAREGALPLANATQSGLFENSAKFKKALKSRLFANLANFKALKSKFFQVGFKQIQVGFKQSITQSLAQSPKTQARQGDFSLSLSLSFS